MSELPAIFALRLVAGQWWLEAPSHDALRWEPFAAPVDLVGSPYKSRKIRERREKGHVVAKREQSCIHRGTAI
jgi:hypothetical protein